MSLHHSPRIVTNGLTLCLDAANPKSFNSAHNLLPYSDTLSQWQKGTNTTLTFNAAYAPNGTLTATRFQTTAGSGTFITSPAFSLVQGIPYCFSFYARKAASNSTLTYYITPSVGQGTSLNPTLVDHTDWRRVYYVYTPSSSGTYYVEFDNNVNTQAVDAYIWGHQVNVGTIPVDYVETSDTPVSFNTSWSDLSEYQQTALLINSPTFDKTNLGEIVFAGTRDTYIRIPHNATTLAPPQITVGILAYKQDWSTSSERLFSKTESGSYSLCTDFSPGNLTGVVYIAGSYRVVSIPLTSLIGSWQYFTLSCDGRYIKLYVNGVLVSTYDHGSSAGITHSPANPHLLIGAEPSEGTTIDTNNSRLTGKVAYFTVHNRMLSDAEVQQNFNTLKGRFGL